jgi:Regulator of ribonuclease activity B
MDTAIMSIFVAACAAIAGVMFFVRGARLRAMSIDGRVIAQLHQAGSDVTKPHPVEFFFYFSSQETADRVAARLNDFGLASKVEPAAHGEEWAILASKTMIPTDADMTQLRDAFEKIAAAEHGTYDGWGSPVVR